MIINIKLLHKDAIVPQFAHSTDSCFDLSTCEDLTVKASKKSIIPTGFEIVKIV